MMSSKIFFLYTLILLLLSSHSSATFRRPAGIFFSYSPCLPLPERHIYVLFCRINSDKFNLHFVYEVFQATLFQNHLPAYPLSKEYHIHRRQPRKLAYSHTVQEPYIPSQDYKETSLPSLSHPQSSLSPKNHDLQQNPKARRPTKRKFPYLLV